MLTEKQAAAWLGYHPGSLERLRRIGGGPLFRRTPTGRIRYAKAALDAWAGRDLRHTA